MKDYYKILEISPNASDDEIRRAFRSKSKSCHPDLFPNNKEKEEEFKLINEAQEALLNKPKETLIPIPNIPYQFVTVNITIKELYCDSEKEIEYSIRKDKCPHCNGYGKVRRQQQTPFGFIMTDGPCPYCKGTGRIGEQIKKTYKTSAKKLFVEKSNFIDNEVRIIIDPTIAKDLNWGLKFDGTLIHRIDIDIPLAVLGGKKEITLLDDSKIKINIPKGTQFGSLLSVAGKGLTPESNLIIELNIKIPTELTEKEEQLYKELQNG